MTAPVRVLVADDDATIRQTLCELIDAENGLELAGVAVDAATAMEQCDLARPDVVLLDVGMPGGGVHAARTIRERCPGVAILALTGRDDVHTRQAMLAAGAAAVLIKGLRRRTLLEAIHAASSAT